eukprot:m.31254 g.31254  ORF g.31254 m.31254 type:complete len:688 (+) comp9707_c0_seq1:242-2305(+)
MSQLKRAKPTDIMATTTKCVDTIRVLAADTVEKAKSGHPGAPMGCAPIAHVLFGEVMKFSPSNPKWVDRDRFVLSNGHACALQYAMLHLSGYDLSMDDLKNFRQLGSKTPGHPENHITTGIEVSTGPLGQGISNAVGLAIAERHLASVFNKDAHNVIDHFTYVLCGDGCLQEGVSSEASSLAGHLGLGKLVVLYDDNQIQIDGGTDLAFGEDVLARYAAYGWHTSTVANGDTDFEAIRKAIDAAKAVTDKPSIIKVRTTIGLGSAKQATAKVHGAPLGTDDIAAVKTKYGFSPSESFVVPAEVQSFYADRKTAGDAAQAAWTKAFGAYSAAHPELAAQLAGQFEGKLPAGWDSELPTYSDTDGAQATRKYSHHALAKLIPAIPAMIGGSADLTPSNLTRVPAHDADFSKTTPNGRYLRFGVREHGMAAVCNGMAAHGGLIPFGATFLVFSGYALGSIRLSALSGFQVIYVMTHDSIGLGEDGPTHQPVETLATLRAMPNHVVIRPADGNETSGAFKIALNNKTGPTTLALSRQNCINIPGSSIDVVAKGAYVVSQGSAGTKVILAATGSEVQLAIKAAALLEEAGLPTRVVSFPSWELFENQPVEYRAEVFPEGIPIVAVEAACSTGWERYSHAQVSINTFGTSAPGPKAFEHFGYTPEKVAEKAKKVAEHFKGAAPVPAGVHGLTF